MRNTLQSGAVLCALTRGTDCRDYAVWEIHPVMKLNVKSD